MTSPSDIASYISLLESPQCAQHPAQQFCTSEQIKQLGRQFSRQANKADAQLRPLIKEFKLILTALRFIRRTVESRWFHHAIIKLPPDERIGVPCPNERKKSALRLVRQQGTNTRSHGRSGPAEVMLSWIWLEVLMA